MFTAARGPFILALFFVPLAACSQPSQPQPSVSAEVEALQAAMDSMMADNRIIGVTPSTVSNNSWADHPTGPGAVPLAPDYLRYTPTAYFYCWLSIGDITHQDESSAGCLPETPVRRVHRAAQKSGLSVTQQELSKIAIVGVGVIALLVLWWGLPRNYMPPVEHRGEPGSYRPYPQCRWPQGQSDADWTR